MPFGVELELVEVRPVKVEIGKPARHVLPMPQLVLGSTHLKIKKVKKKKKEWSLAKFVFRP
jgi:hypothetical protein